MEVENNEDSFLEDSVDTDDSQTQTETQTKPKREQAKEQTSATVRLCPLPIGFSESDVCEWIQSLTGKTPKCIAVRYLKSKRSRGKFRPTTQDSFIVFDSIADASFCVPKIDGQTIPNAEVACQCQVTSPTQVKNTDLSGTTSWMIMSGLSQRTTEQDILSHIQQKSGITNKPKVIRLVQHDNEKFSGRAFVECANPEDATKCVENMQLTTLCGSKIWCYYRIVKSGFNRREALANNSSCILLVNLHYSLCDEDVCALCDKYGEVKDVVIWYDSAGYRKGMAVVTMGSTEAATKAYEGLHGEKVKNLELITSYFEKRVNKVKQPKRTGGKRDSLKKQIVKSKNIKKKLQSDNNTKSDIKMKSGKGRGKGRSGPKIA